MGNAAKSRMFIWFCTNLNSMCSAGGPVEVDLNDPLKGKGKKYKCNECGATFTGLGKHPMCPTCQSEDVTEI